MREFDLAPERRIDYDGPKEYLDGWWAGRIAEQRERELRAIGVSDSMTLLYAVRYNEATHTIDYRHRNGDELAFRADRAGVTVFDTRAETVRDAMATLAERSKAVRLTDRDDRFLETAMREAARSGVTVTNPELQDRFAKIQKEVGVEREMGRAEMRSRDPVATAERSVENYALGRGRTIVDVPADRDITGRVAYARDRGDGSTTLLIDDGKSRDLSRVTVATRETPARNAEVRSPAVDRDEARRLVAVERVNAKEQRLERER